MSKDTKDWIQDQINSYGLKGSENKLAGALSGGMRKRTALIRAIASLSSGRGAKLLVCDEPFSAIDYVNRLRLSSVFKSQIHDRGITTLVVTHDIEEAIFLGNFVYVMSKDGRIVSKYNTFLEDYEHDRIASKNSEISKNLFNHIWKDLSRSARNER